MKTLVFVKDPQIRATFTEALKARGHQYVVAETFGAARSAYDDEEPLFVVIGQVDPESLDLSRHIRQSERSEVVMVLVIVPELQQWTIQNVLEAGADDYVIAPLVSDRVMARLEFAERKVADKLLHKRNESELRARVQQQAIVAELGRRALTETDLQAMMDHIVEVTPLALGVELCKIAERIPGEDRLLIRAGRGWQEGVVGSLSLAIGDQTQAGYTFGMKEPVVVENLNQDSRFTDPHLLRRHGIVSGMSVTISGETGIYGVLSVHTAKQHAFSRDDVHFLQSVANVLAALIDRLRREDALRDSEAKARAIVDTTVDGVITIDECGIIQSYNPSAERIFGFGPEEVIGQNVAMLMTEQDAEMHDEYMRRYLETGVRKIIGIGREVIGRRKDGTTFPLDLAVSEVWLGERRIFTGIVRDITERRRLEQEILETSEQERRRIGQDLHDGLGQMLTGIGLISQNITRRMENGEAVSADELREVTELIREADQHARGLARGLVPVELDAGGLSAALQRLTNNAVRLFGIRCTFEELGSVLIEDTTAATHLYRIAQEAVSNAVKHGRAEQVTVTLASGDEQIRLRIADDGIGFPEVLGENRGMGVRIMHYRARIIGASLEIRQIATGGTLVTCTLQRNRIRTNTGRTKARRTTR